MADDDVRSVDMDLARRRYDDAVTMRSHWDKLAKKDLEFKAGTDGETSYQWDQTVQSQRNSDNRPCFTINRIPSFVKQVVNEWRQASPSTTVAPVGDGDEDVAEVYQGIIRHIVSNDDGEIALDTAVESAVSAGLGWVFVVPRYVDEDGDDQELYLDWVPNIFAVYWDMAAVKPDRSDMRYCFRVTTLPIDEYEAQWGKLSSEDMAAISGLPEHQNARWFPQGSVTIADYYELVETKRKDRRPGKKKVIWRTINGISELARTEIPIGRIPAVPCFGDQVFLGGKEDYRGMIRDGLDAQTAFNYWYTSITEQIALGTKGQYVLDPRQIENLENFWKNANKTNFPYLPALRWITLPDGQTVDAGFPQRDIADPPIEAMTVALNYADQALKQVMNLYEPSLGQRKSEQSGRAILALQQQGQIGNANYTDNGKRFLRSLGRLLLMMAPIYYDSARVLRIIGKDEKPQTVMVHAGADNKPSQPPEGISKIYDLSTGRYDVTVTTGPSYVNKRQEQLDHTLEFLKVNPPAAQVSGDIIAGLMELPELQNRLKKTLPPQFQDDGSPEAELAKAQAQLQQAMKINDLLVKEVQEKTRYIETEQAKQQAQVAMKEIDAKAKVATAQLDRDAKIVVASIQAKMADAKLRAEAAASAAELLHTHAHEATEAGLAREHEAEIAEAQRRADAVSQSREFTQESAEAGADRSHEAEQADLQRAHDAVSQRADLDAAAEQAQNNGASAGT